jgi:hypothetical protein
VGSRKGYGRRKKKTQENPKEDCAGKDLPELIFFPHNLVFPHVL